MDVHCSTCGEPWDTYHLWHDAIWDTGLSEGEIREWEKIGFDVKISGLYETEDGAEFESAD